MNICFPATVCRVTLAAQDDFADWRQTARALLTENTPPSEIFWSVKGDDEPDMFAASNWQAAPSLLSPDVRIPRSLLDLMRLGLLHSDAARFALAYRIMWRLRREPSLYADPTDPDMIALGRLAKAVRRDIHKMHAFVRFRKVGEVNGREQFASWFEPDHHICRAVAGFFRNRFAGMDWMVVTPETSIRWDGMALSEGPGGCRSDVPGADAVEAEWRAYYASIFNPARVKIAAMKKEMPVRYWRNLPESALISDLIRKAETRVDEMVKHARNETDLFASDTVVVTEPKRNFRSLKELYEDLCEEDRPPSEGFSDRIIFSEGPPTASLMFVGEQPGDQEDNIGRPFVGPAGQMFDACLAEAGIDRSRVFLTNAVKRFKFTLRGKRRLHATPTAGDIAHYRWWLAEEVRLVAPDIVVALGATALQALTGRKQALSPLRGEVLPWQDHRLLVTVHPSYLLRLPDEQARDIERERFIRDLRKATTIG